MDELMTTQEMARLSEWLLSHGKTEHDVLECLRYIAGESELPGNDCKNDHAED